MSIPTSRCACSLDDATSVDIPLVADRLVPGEATLPDGYTLEELKVE